MKPGSRVEWLSLAHAAEHLDLPSPRALREFIATQKERGLPYPKVYRLGRRLRFRRVDLDACLEPEPEQQQRSVVTSLRVVRRSS